MNKTLSVATYVDNPLSKEFYLKELIESVWNIADEIIVVNGDKEGRSPYSETYKLIYDIEEERNDFNKIKVYHNPWEWRMGKNMGRLQRSLAVSHCTKDYVLLLDADEIIHEVDHDKIRKAMELGHDVYSFKTLHFYRHFYQILQGQNPSDPPNEFYVYRPKMFKNGLGILDMHDYKGNYSGLITFDGRDCQEISKRTSIRIFHVGHVRSKESYVRKTNDIERSYHPHHHDIKVDEFDWPWQSACIPYDGDYPKVLVSRIKLFENKYGKYND